MKRVLRIFLIAVIFIAGSAAFLQQNSKNGGFFENFSRSSSRIFQPHTGGKGADFIWRFGVRSPSDRKTKVLSLKIDPEDPAGAGRGPEIISNNFTHFGSYATRLKIPDVRIIQRSLRSQNGIQ